MSVYDLIINSFLIIVIATIIVCIALGLLLSKKFGSKRFRKAASLQKDLGNDYMGVDTSIAQLVGKEGIATTDLRPAGKIKIDGVRYDATSTCDFIPAGKRVKVVRYEAAQLYVDQL